MRERPIEYCYWVADNLLAGEYPGDIDEDKAKAKVESLLRAGVSVFIDLTEDGEHSAYTRGRPLVPYAHLAESAEHLRFAIPDGRAPESGAFTTAILDAIDRHIEEGHGVYVHCLGGVGRTGTVVGCWLSRHGHPGSHALERLGQLWQQNPKSLDRDSPERSAQVRYVRSWREPGE